MFFKLMWVCSDKYNAYRDAYNMLANRVLTVADPVNLPILGSQHLSSMPDIPACQTDFPKVKFWHKQDWQNFVKSGKGLSDFNPKGSSERGRSRASHGENVKMQYIEEENGEPVSGHRATEMCRIARSIWAHLSSIWKALKTWMKASAVSLCKFNNLLTSLLVSSTGMRCINIFPNFVFANWIGKQT
jgi:hypothetical protein